MSVLNIEAVEAGLDLLAGSARRTGRSVQQLSKWSANPRCGTSSAMFAARVDSDRLLTGTPYEVPFGQSRAAMARGARVERIARENDYAVTLSLVREHLSFATREVVAVNLRRGFPPNRSGMQRRAKETLKHLRAMLEQRPDAPNLIEGAVLPLRLGGRTYHLEADTLGMRNGPALHIVEIKGYAVIDGRIDDAAKLGRTVDQMGFYGYLARLIVDELGFDADAVISPQGLLITPKNMALTLTGTPITLSRAVRVAETVLDRVPKPDDYVDQVPPEVNFGAIADVDSDVDNRIDVLRHLQDTYGTHYTPECASSCGLWRVCRDRAVGAGQVALAGPRVAKGVPGVATFSRVGELVAGAPPTPTETAVAAHLTAAVTLLDLAEEVA